MLSAFRGSYSGLGCTIYACTIYKKKTATWNQNSVDVVIFTSCVTDGIRRLVNLVHLGLSSLSVKFTNGYCSCKYMKSPTPVKMTFKSKFRWKLCRNVTGPKTQIKSIHQRKDAIDLCMPKKMVALIVSNNRPY